MDLKIGDVFAKKYVIWDLPPDVGGMGRVLFVHPKSKSSEKIALKYCKLPMFYERFKREVTILRKYEGNSKVIQILDHDLNSTPPYFTMPYASKGDVYSRISKIKGNHELQEKVFYRLIDAVAELHANEDYHRDIKPQNFLLMDDGSVVVSDFGLAKLADAGTVLTNTRDAGGTHEYCPPEYYMEGGFKQATAGWDIYSLGKTFYRLYTDRNATHLANDGVPASLFHVIRKCCENNPDARYKSLTDLRQAVNSAYDIILNRLDPGANFTRLLDMTTRKLNEGKLNSDQFLEILEILPSLDDDTQIYFADNLPERFLAVVASRSDFSVKAEAVLDAYEKMLQAKVSRNVGFSYAEVVARDMAILFNSDYVENRLKARCLNNAVEWAVKLSRFAAMDTCAELIKSVTDEELGFMVADIIAENSNHGFITSIEPSACKAHSIRKKLIEIRKKADEDDLF